MSANDANATSSVRSNKVDVCFNTDNTYNKVNVSVSTTDCAEKPNARKVRVKPRSSATSVASDAKAVPVQPKKRDIAMSPIRSVQNHGIFSAEKTKVISKVFAQKFIEYKYLFSVNGDRVIEAIDVEQGKPVTIAIRVLPTNYDEKASKENAYRHEQLTALLDIVVDRNAQLYFNVSESLPCFNIEQYVSQYCRDEFAVRQSVHFVMKKLVNLFMNMQDNHYGLEPVCLEAVMLIVDQHGRLEDVKIRRNLLSRCASTSLFKANLLKIASFFSQDFYGDNMVDWKLISEETWFFISALPPSSATLSALYKSSYILDSPANWDLAKRRSNSEGSAEWDVLDSDESLSMSDVSEDDNDVSEGEEDKTSEYSFASDKQTHGSAGSSVTGSDVEVVDGDDVDNQSVTTAIEAEDEPVAAVVEPATAESNANVNYDATDVSLEEEDNASEYSFGSDKQTHGSVESSAGSDVEVVNDNEFDNQSVTTAVEAETEPAVTAEVQAVAESVATATAVEPEEDSWSMSESSEDEDLDTIADSEAEEEAVDDTKSSVATPVMSEDETQSVHTAVESEAESEDDTQSVATGVESEEAADNNDNQSVSIAAETKRKSTERAEKVLAHCADYLGLKFDSKNATLTTDVESVKMKPGELAKKLEALMPIFYEALAKLKESAATTAVKSEDDAMSVATAIEPEDDAMSVATAVEPEDATVELEDATVNTAVEPEEDNESTVDLETIKAAAAARELEEDTKSVTTAVEPESESEDEAEDDDEAEDAKNAYSSTDNSDCDYYEEKEAKSVTAAVEPESEDEDEAEDDDDEAEDAEDAYSSTDNSDCDYDEEEEDSDCSVESDFDEADYYSDCYSESEEVQTLKEILANEDLQPYQPEKEETQKSRICDLVVQTDESALRDLKEEDALVETPAATVEDDNVSVATAQEPEDDTASVTTAVEEPEDDAISVATAKEAEEDDDNCSVATAEEAHEDVAEVAETPVDTPIETETPTKTATTVEYEPDDDIYAYGSPDIITVKQFLNLEDPREGKTRFGYTIKNLNRIGRHGEITHKDGLITIYNETVTRFTSPCGGQVININYLDEDAVNFIDYNGTTYTKYNGVPCYVADALAIVRCIIHDIYYKEEILAFKMLNSNIEFSVRRDGVTTMKSDAHGTFSFNPLRLAGWQKKLFDTPMYAVALKMLLLTPINPFKPAKIVIH